MGKGEIPMGRTSRRPSGLSICNIMFGTSRRVNLFCDNSKLPDAFVLFVDERSTSGQVDPKCGARLEGSVLTGAALWCFPTGYGGNQRESWEDCLCR